MKKAFYLLLCCLLTTCLFTACSSEDDEQNDFRIWDIYPIEFKIFITDSEGNDLLDSTYQYNIINEVSASYQGEVYPLKKYPDSYYRKATTRVYVPHFEGLLLKRYWNSMTYTYGNFEMVFGEFDGTENVDKRQIILHLPDSYQVRLSYKNSYKWISNDDGPQKNTQFFLDDQELKDNAGVRGTFHFRYSKDGGYEYIPSDIN